MQARFVSLLLAATLSPALADEIRIEGVRSARDVTCEQGQGVVVTGTDHRVALSGACGSVEIYGSAHRISFETASTLQVGGFTNRVSGRETGKLTVEGRENTVETGVAAGQDTAAVEVSGSQHALDLRLAGPARITVHGARSAILWTAEPGVKAPRVDISGIENKVARR